jgi:hypothetical protein
MPSAAIFWCSCVTGWEGRHCEKQVNYCENVTCLNKGICRPLLLGYQCECLSGMYSGLHCEYTATSILIRQYTSKTFASVAIIMISSMVIFVITLDVLKYVFHIDVAKHEREKMRQNRAPKKREIMMSKQPRIALRFIYVNKSPVAEQSV